MAETVVKDDGGSTAKKTGGWAWLDNALDFVSKAVDVGGDAVKTYKSFTAEQTPVVGSSTSVASYGVGSVLPAVAVLGGLVGVASVLI